MPRRKQALGKKSKLSRKASRKKIGRLKDQVVAPKTLERYKFHVGKFLTFLAILGMCFPTSFLELDEMVCMYVEQLWEDGDPKGWAGDTISGLGHFFPNAKKSLAGSWRLHGAWGRAELPSRATPFTPLIVYALAYLAWKESWVDTAVLLILGFHRFPRSGELFSATAGDFTLDDSLNGVWGLPLTKSGQRFGAKESLVLEDPWVVGLLKNFLEGKLPGDSLSSVRAGIQRSRLKKLVELAGLGDENFQWYSCRRGGATHAFRKTNNLGWVCTIGRWGNTRTARIYITDALAQLTEMSLSAAVRKRLEAWAKAARPDYATA